MICNPLLATMTADDIARRYRGTYIRYDNQIFLVNDINSPSEWLVTTGNKTTMLDFKADKLDISRPVPRWVMVDNTPYYVNYLFTRQWHRGFCATNCVIRPVGKRQLMWPGMTQFKVLNALYEPLYTLHTSSEDAVLGTKKNGHMLLSSQILLTLGATEEPLVYFREKCIGIFGRLQGVEAVFIQELKELIGDYTNDDNVPDVPLTKGRNKKNQWLWIQDEFHPGNGQHNQPVDVAIRLRPLLQPVHEDHL